MNATKIPGRASRALVAGLALLAAPLARPAHAALAHAAPAPPADEPARVAVTERDVLASNQEAASAYQALVAMWRDELGQRRAPFRAPSLVAYRDGVRSACGVLGPSNAMYCLNDNTIYFDEVFLAAQAKIAGSALGTDGDMAGVGIIAHEMGHAVAFQLGRFARDSYTNEATADCLAGAFAQRSERDGSLEAGDTEEAFYAMAAAADPEIRPTGNARVDRRNAVLLARGRHGTREQRQANFRLGLERGSAACLGD